MKKLLMLVVAAGLVCPVWALSDNTASANTPPAKPGGDDDHGSGGGTPPDKPSGGDDDSVALSGAWQFDSGTNTLSATVAGATLSSTNSDENVILAQTNGTTVTVSNYTLNKSGDCSNEDNSNFFAVNAVVAAKSAARVYLNNSTLISGAKGANCLFATGEGSTIYAYDCALTSTKDSSRGLDATYEGKVIASKLTIDTSGDHCATLATDRGNGYISATECTLSTDGQGSPLIYSTGVIEVNAVTGTANGAQIAGIEGLSTIRIKNSDLTGSAEKASESVPNGVLIYQSGSGDSTDGTATFEVAESTLKSTISDGAMFYITHSEAVITVQNTVLDFDTASNDLILAAGNNGENGWGTVGSNGGKVVFTAIDQTLKGTISVDGISSLDLYLTNSTYTGTFDTTDSADGVNMFISSNSTWTVTDNCTLDTLTVTDGATIKDGDGNVVTIVEDGETRISGSSAFTVSVSDYVSGTFAMTNITPFKIDRTAFEKMYGSSQDSGGGSGGADDHNNWTNYFKPYPPDNAIVKVRVAGATEYGNPDKDHKYCLDGYWDGDEDNGIEVRLLYKATEGYLFPDGSVTNVWIVTVTNNAQEVYPPEGVVTLKAQAKSGSTDYLTLKAAVDAAKARATISLYDDVTLEETLTSTNSITLDLATNVVTLSPALTQAFHFTGGATISNGTINSSLAANVEGSALLRFTDCKATLRDLTINGRGYASVVVHDSTVEPIQKYTATRHSLDKVTCDGLVVTGNGCLVSVDYADATLTNNCSLTADNSFASFGGSSEAAVSCSGNATVTIADGVYAAPKALQSGDLGGKFVVNGGTFAGRIYSWMSLGAHTNLEQYADYKAQFALNAGSYDEATIAFADASSRSLDVFTKGEDVSIGIPAGYAWVDNTLVGQAIAPGVSSEPYDDALSATNAAAQINADKASCIGVPTGVETSAKTTYLSKVAAVVTPDNRVVVGLTPAAEAEVQGELDEALTNETAVASLTTADAAAKVTIAATTPGLYYWIRGGTDVGAITNAGASVLSTNGGSVELTKPALDTTQNKAFFGVASGLASPDAATVSD